jgi:hypothetical protein
VSPEADRTPEAAAREASASARLRDRIDHSETSEKVNFSDPAAAPLGTDAEAGGVATQGIEAPAPGPREEGPRTPRELQSRTVTYQRLAVYAGVGFALFVLVALLLAGMG